MTSKWITDFWSLDPENKRDGDFTRKEREEILLRIDKLLRLAKAGTDDERLLNLIWEEIKEDNFVTKPVKAVRGVSSVVPVTEEEAERIMDEIEGKNGN